MSFYKFIKIKGADRKIAGYVAPRVYRLDFSLKELKIVGFRFVKERLSGWTIWWVSNEDDFNRAVKMLNQLKETHDIEFEELILQ